MLETVNKIFFKQSDFDSKEEMFVALFLQELALTRNNYMCLVYKSLADDNVFVLEFASTEPAFNLGKLLPCWITPSEARAIASARLEDYQESAEDIVKDSLKLDVDDDNNDNGGNNFDA